MRISSRSAQCGDVLVCEEHLLPLRHLNEVKEGDCIDYNKEDAHDDHGHTYCVSCNRSHTAIDSDTTSNNNMLIYFTPFVASPFESFRPPIPPDAHAVYDNLDDTPVTPPIQGLCIYFLSNESITTSLDTGTVTPSDEGNKLLVYILAYNTNDLLTPTLRHFSSLTSLPLSPTTSPLTLNDNNSSNVTSVKEPLYICLSTLNSQQHEQKQEPQEGQYSPVYESPLDRLTHRLKRVVVATALKNK